MRIVYSRRNDVYVCYRCGHSSTFERKTKRPFFKWPYLPVDMAYTFRKEKNHTAIHHDFFCQLETIVVMMQRVFFIMVMHGNHMECPEEERGDGISEKVSAGKKVNGSFYCYTDKCCVH